jgi:hypothetical protein
MTDGTFTSDADLIAAVREAAAPHTTLIALLMRLDREAQLVTVQRTVFERLNEELGRYPVSNAAWAYQLVVSNALDMVALGIARLWDETDDAFSIPNAARILRTGWTAREIAFEWLDGERRIAQSSKFVASSDPSEQAEWRRRRMLSALDAALVGPVKGLERRNELQKRIRSARKSQSLVHLQELRSTVHAHALDITEKGKRRRKAGEEVRFPYVGELLALADETIEIVAEFNLMVQALQPDYAKLRNQWRGHASDLVARGLKG